MVLFRGGGVCGFRGACVVLFWGHAWFYSGGHAWFYLGACMVLFGGACMVLFGGCVVLFGEHAWFYLGGHAWFYLGGMVLFWGCGFWGGMCGFSGGDVHGFFSFFGYNEIRSMSGVVRILLECILVVITFAFVMVIRGSRLTRINIYFFQALVLCELTKNTIEMTHSMRRRHFINPEAARNVKHNILI